MPDISYPGTALAGILSFLSPCVLPMLPFYLCYLAGLPVAQITSGRDISTLQRTRLWWAATGFALGVTTIFVLLGLGASAAGQVMAEWRRPLSWVAAGIILIFGLQMTGLLQMPVLSGQARMHGPRNAAGPFGGYLMGLAFGFGWTPCVGPVLSVILLMAAGRGDIGHGAGLLLTYGLAMTLPFVLCALALRPAMDWLMRQRAHLRHLQKITGVGLIVFAVLIATDNVARISAWLLAHFDFSLFLA